MHSLKIVAISLFATHVASLAIELDKRGDNITLPAPIVAVPSEHWEGVDGTWSTFEIRVGTPDSASAPSNVYRVLPATSWQETWVVYGAAAGFCDTSLGVSSDCAEARGGVFDSAKSSTWNQTYANATQDQYQLGLNGQLGESGIGQYGFDTVGLGYTTDQGPTLTHQIVSEIVSDTWWFGILGLGFQPTNFTTYTDPQPSFADSLWTNGSIASMSWSYTAGAWYRLKTVYGSLIFGGYDASRFTPNDLTFHMAGDNLRDIVVTLRSITSTTSSGNTTLMSTPELIFIDSTVPELWLPTDVCKQFETAFGIALDNTTGTYLVDDSTRQKLLNLNPNITLTLADQKTGGTTIDIVLPYSAFDQNVTAPILPNRTSWYFPIMQASDSSQYTLGRTFLQEAYVTTHYNSRTFNVSQAVFDDSAEPTVIAIPSVLPTSTSGSGGSGGNGTTGNTGSSHKKLSGGAIAGIVIGVLAAIAVAGSIIACCLMGMLCFRKKDSRPRTPDVVEIDTGKRIEPAGSSAYESQASAFTSEMPGQDSKVEIQGNPIMHPQELEAEVPMVAGTREAERVNGPSDSSRETGVSSLSPITERGERKTPMAELGAQERGLGYGTTSMGERVNHEHVVSPSSPTIPSNSMMGRQREDVSSGGRESPTISEATWTPTTPVQRRGTSGSRFQERWND